jgi:ketosteroid isomerase-like protein
MRRIAATLTLPLFVGALLGCASALAPEEDDAAVRAAHAKLIAAYNSCDAAAFVAAYAAAFTFSTSYTAAPYTTIPALQRYHAAGCRQTPSPQVTLKSESIRVAGSARVLTGQYVFRLSSSNGPRDVTQNYTAVMVQEAGLWRMAAHHVSLAP